MDLNHFKDIFQDTLKENGIDDEMFADMVNHNNRTLPVNNPYIDDEDDFWSNEPMTGDVLLGICDIWENRFNNK